MTTGGATKTYAKTTVKDDKGFDSAKWKRTAPEAKDLETNKVEDALFKIGGIEVAEFVDQPKGPEAYGLDAPAFTLVIRSGAGKGEQKLELGQQGRRLLRPPPRRRLHPEARHDQDRRAGQGVLGAVAGHLLEESRVCVPQLWACRCPAKTFSSWGNGRLRLRRRRMGSRN